MRLYEIDQAIEEALNRVQVDEETGEVTANPDLEMLEKLQMERDQKIENVGIFIKNAKAEAEALAQEAKRLTERKRVLENRMESAKGWLAMALAGERFDSTRVQITFRTTESTEIDDINKIPEEFLKYAEPTADKTAIKKAIKDGEEIAGAHIEKKQSMIVK